MLAALLLNLNVSRPDPYVPPSDYRRKRRLEGKARESEHDRKRKEHEELKAKIARIYSELYEKEETRVKAAEIMQQFIQKQPEITSSGNFIQPVINYRLLFLQMNLIRELIILYEDTEAEDILLLL